MQGSPVFSSSSSERKRMKMKQIRHHTTEKKGKKNGGGGGGARKDKKTFPSLSLFFLYMQRKHSINKTTAIAKLSTHLLSTHSHSWMTFRFGRSDDAAIWKGGKKDKIPATRQTQQRDDLFRSKTSTITSAGRQKNSTAKPRPCLRDPPRMID